MRGVIVSSTFSHEGQQEKAQRDSNDADDDHHHEGRIIRAAGTLEQGA